MNQKPDNGRALVELAYRRSSDAVQAQVAIATSFDQRSLVFATLSVAAAALVYNALNKTPAFFWGQGASIFFCVSSVFSAFSAAPGRIYTNGSKVSELDSFIHSDTDYTNVLYGLCKNNDEYIDANEKWMRVRAHLYRFSLFLFAVGALMTVAGFAIAPKG